MEFGLVFIAIPLFLCEVIDENGYFSNADCKMKDIHIPFSVYKNCRTNESVPDGTEIEISCLNGYVLHGESSNITCLDGKWDVFPECLSACSEPEIPQGIRGIQLKPLYLEGEEIYLHCENGFFLQNDHPRSVLKIACQGRDKWPTIPKCYPYEKFEMMYLVQEVDNVELIPGQSLNLKCILQGSTSEIAGWMWRIGQKDIFDASSDRKSRYKISSNGTLNISFVKASDTGMYVCMGQRGKQYEIGLVAYNVQFTKPGGSQPNATRSLYLREGGSAFITCPFIDYERNNAVKFVWYINGTRVVGNNEISVLPSGELFIKEVSVVHQGKYVCEVSSELWWVKDRFFYDIRVNFTNINSVCGVENSSNSGNSGRPWMAFLRRKHEEKPFCYGVLVSEKWVLTTSFCLFGIHKMKNPDIMIAVGNNVNPIASKGFDHYPGWLAVELAIIHPDYIFTNKFYYNDVGLVKLLYPVTFSNSIKPVCLSDYDETFNLPYYNYPCDQSEPLVGELFGYGTLRAGSHMKLEAREENMTLLAPKTCWDFGKFTFSRNLMCAESTEFPPVIAGDYGAPLEIKKNGKVHLVGILSSSDRFPEKGPYDYFTKISDFYPWIRHHALSESCVE